jgi:hypothetical protein
VTCDGVDRISACYVGAYEQTTFFCEIDSTAGYASDEHDAGRKGVDAGARAVYTGNICGGQGIDLWAGDGAGGAFGMAVFEVADEAEVRGVLENDPPCEVG